MDLAQIASGADLYPYYFEHISCRLSQDNSKLRNLLVFEKVIGIEGSGHLFLQQISGNQSIRDIENKISTSANVTEKQIHEDFCSVLLSLSNNGIIGFSDKPQNLKNIFTDIIAPSIRSSIHFDITHKCNERCVHCLVNNDKSEATLHEIKDLIHQAAVLGFTNFSFSGGEPTLHKGFWELLELSRACGFYFTLFTNGINFNVESIKRLAVLYPEKVRISLYSMNPKIHDQITNVSGSFHKTMSSILEMKKQGIRSFINCPVMNINYPNFRDVATFCYDNNIERSFDPVIRPTRDSRSSNTSLQLSYEQAKDVTGFQQDAKELIANVKHDKPVCNVGEDLSIDANLNVYPCPSLRVVLGNLKEKSLSDIIDNNETINVASKLSLNDLLVCQYCEVRDGCYRCHGHAYQDAGDFTKCSPSDKRQAKIRRELMIERGSLKEQLN